MVATIGLIADFGRLLDMRRCGSTKPILTARIEIGESSGEERSLMSNPNECSAVYPTLAVSSVENTGTWYVEKLGFSVRFLWGERPTHGAILLGDACVHFWKGDPQLGENWIYFDVTNLDAMHGRAKANGVEITRDPKDYPWGMREFNAVDLNGYGIRFGQHLGQ